jgi:hypothetical protein
MSYVPGVQTLQSEGILRRHAGDRPSFRASIARTFSSPTFQVFAMPQGLLFIELRYKPQAVAAGPSKAALLLTSNGGAIGGLVAGMIESGRERHEPEWETGLELCSDDELVALARSRRRSFVANKEAIRSITIDPPGLFRRMFGGATTGGWIIVRTDEMGDIRMEVHDPAHLQVAVDTLPRHFGDRVAVNVVFDHRAHRFVRSRRAKL